jgi:hypothetical protein
MDLAAILPAMRQGSIIEDIPIELAKRLVEVANNWSQKKHNIPA